MKKTLEFFIALLCPRKFQTKQISIPGFHKVVLDPFEIPRPTFNNEDPWKLHIIFSALLHFRTPSIVIDDSSLKNAAESFTVTLTLGGYESAISPFFRPFFLGHPWKFHFFLSNHWKFHMLFLWYIWKFHNPQSPVFFFWNSPVQ